MLTSSQPRKPETDLKSHSQSDFLTLKVAFESLLRSECSFVYPYPSASALAGGNSDHGPRKARTQNPDHPGLCILYVKIKGVIFSTLLDEVRQPVPYTSFQPPTSSLKITPNVFIGERRNSDHGLSFCGGKTQTIVRVSGVLG